MQSIIPVDQFLKSSHSSTLLTQDTLQGLSQYAKSRLGDGAICYTIHGLDNSIFEELIDEFQITNVAILNPNLPEVVMRYDIRKKMWLNTPTIHNNVFYIGKYNLLLVHRFPDYINNVMSSSYVDIMYGITVDDILACLQAIDAYVVNKNVSKFTLFTNGGSGLKVQSIELSTVKSTWLPNQLTDMLTAQINTFFADNGAFYRQHNIPYRRGILLYGKPGNGKTSFIRHLVDKLEVPLISWQVSEYTDSDNMAQVMSMVWERAPVVLVIEDLDSIPLHSRSTFLNSLDGLGAHEGVFIIGTTNYPDRVDPGLKHRAGRFDQTYEFTGPDKEQCRHLLELKGLRRHMTDAQFEYLLANIAGISYANVNELYVSLLFNLHHHGDMLIEQVVAQLQETTEHIEKDNWYEREGQIGFVGKGVKGRPVSADSSC